MNCREYVDFLMAYLNGELPGEQGKDFEKHIGDCPPCLTYLDTYRETIKAGKMACKDAEELCEEAPERLVEAILAARRKD